MRRYGRFGLLLVPLTVVMAACSGGGAAIGAERTIYLAAIEPKGGRQLRITDAHTTSITKVVQPPATASHSAAGGSTIDFGRYAGWTFAQMARQDEEYLRWLSRHSAGSRYLGEIARQLEAIVVKPVRRAVTPRRRWAAFARGPRRLRRWGRGVRTGHLAPQWCGWVLSTAMRSSMAVG